MAGEICIAVIPEIVKSALEAATRQTCYSFCFNKYVDDLQRKKRELTIAKESVQNRLEKAKQATKKVDTLVINWLEEVNSLIEEVQKLEEKANSNKSYCFGHFPNWIWRYRVAKLAEEKTKEVIELNQKSNNFPEFARPSTPPGMKYFSSEGFFYFENTRMAYDEILDALKDDEVFVIGLYGMGGCGKTTLAKQVGLAAEKTFNKVAFAIVSNNVDVRKIQGEIASYLNLDLKEEEPMLRARRLWTRLTSGEKILIIVDDVWGKLDFEAIGIPLGESRKGCKVLLTTRRLQVCTLMGCQRSIPLSLLNEEEAWVLFQKHSRMGDETSSPLKGLARDIAKECRGLPVAIAAVASTLKGKSLSEWQEALERLKEATPIDVEEGLIDPYKCLQLSYDNLKNEETKSLFLLCSVFPEDFEIHEELLTRYGIGLGLFGKVSSYARVRNKVSEAINKLIDSCLLLKGNKEQCVKMHDLVRDMALFIAKKEKNVIMGKESMEGNLTLEDNYGAIRYLWHFKTQESDNLSYLLGCSKLEFLCVKISKHSALEDGVFKTMKDLRVLIFQGGRYSEQKYLSTAKSIQLLTNLRCLLLEGWSLGDISFIGCLKKLESLELWSCSFEELSNKITELSKLKLLDLWCCVIESNPDEVIRRCSQLEELYFLGNRGRWNEDEKMDVVATSTLQRYRIDIRGCCRHEPKISYITRGLWLKNFDMSSNAAIKELAKRAEFLELRETKNDCKNIIPDVVDIKGGMDQLTKLNLVDCDKIECLVEKIENVFPNLVELYIFNLNCLETWWRGPPVGKLNLFCSLKYLKLYGCPMLTSAFTCAIAQSLVVLENLTINDCEGIKQIVRDEEKDNDENYSTLMFPKLQELVVYKCNKLEYLMPVSFARSLRKLESLSIRRGENLIHVFGQSSTNHEDDNQNRLQIINLPLLKNLSLSILDNIIAICPKNYCPSCPSLKKLYWGACPKLKFESINKCFDSGSGVIISTQEQQSSSNVMHDNQAINELSPSQLVQSIQHVNINRCQKIEGIFQLSENPTSGDLQPLTSCLKYLKIEFLDELSYIYKGPRRFLCLQNLQKLLVLHCAKLKIIFSATVFGSLSQLEELEVRNCPQLEQIIEDGETLELTNELNHYSKNNRGEEFDDISKKPGTSKCLSLYKRLSRRPLNLHKLKTDDEHQKNQNEERVQEVQRHVSMFPRLKLLRIHECGLLESIFLISFGRDLLKLETLSVGNCNIHAVFQLEGFPMTSEQNPLTSRLDYLRLENLPELRFLCKAPKQSLNMKYLSYLTVERCRNLIFIFSSSVLRNLPLLKHLTIKQCEQLQQIIEEDEKDRYSLSYHSQQVCFPSLTTIEIENCINLKYLFTILSSQELPQLNYLYLQECILLENVFAHVESYTKDEHATIFSGLKKLKLIQLPNLISVYKGFMWHSVESKTVTDCPKLTSTIDPSKALAQEDQNQESKEAHETPNETPSMDDASSANTANTSQLDMMDLQSQAPMTNSKEGKDTGLQALTSQDANISAPLAPINQEYLTSEKGGNMKRMENKNVTEQSTTTYPESTEAHQKLVGTVLQESSLHAAPFPQIIPKEYNQNDSGIISDKATNIDKGRGDLQTQELNTSVNQFNTEESLKEQNKNLREFIGETIMESVQKGPASVKSTTENSSLGMVRKATMSDPVSMDHHQEANKVYLGDLPTDLDLNKATDVEQKMPQVSSENKEEIAKSKVVEIAQKDPTSKNFEREISIELVNDSISMEQQKTPDEMKGDASVDFPTLEVEYAPFRDFGVMKKKHVPLIEKAFANHPSLRDWHKKFRRPEMKQLGYTILGNTLEFLESTRWRDLTEEKKAEFESLVNSMEAFGFDIQWLGNTRAKIKHSKLDEGSIKQKQMLEEKVVEEMKVHLQKLLKYKLEAELGNYNDFIGF